MQIKLKLDDFKLDDIKVNNPKHVNGGIGTDSTCTCGDDGCCDDFHTDDTRKAL